MTEFLGNQFKRGISAALIEITHPSLTNPIFLTDNTGGVSYNDRNYIFYKIEFIPPEIGDDSDGLATLTCSSIDQTLITAIRSIDNSKELGVHIKNIYIEDWELGTDPVITELQAWDFSVEYANWDAQTMSLKLALELFLMDDVPSGRFTPFNNQGGVI